MYNNLSVFFFIISGFFTIDNPEYVVSPRGKFMLSQNGFNYTLIKRIRKDDCVKTHWRCTYKGNKFRKGCLATATAYEHNGNSKATFKGFHIHQPQMLTKQQKFTEKAKRNTN